MQSCHNMMWGESPRPPYIDIQKDVQFKNDVVFQSSIVGSGLLCKEARLRQVMARAR